MSRAPNSSNSTASAPSSPRGHGAKKRSTGLPTSADLWHNPGEGNPAMNFCSNCGAPVSRKVPPGDNLPRFVCDACQAIHYENPKIVAGCIPEWEGQILLCRRAIEPKYSLWTVRAGFLEPGETAEPDAAREALE